MENASKALIMAAGILIAIFLITLMIYAFKNGTAVGRIGEQEISRIEIEEFNVHFSKYIGKELTVYDVVSIYNFINSAIRTVTVNTIGFTGPFTKDDISGKTAENYILEIDNYDSYGFVNKITIKE